MSKKKQKKQNKGPVLDFESYDLDQLTKYDKKDLVGVPFQVDMISNEIIGSHGFYKIMFLKVDSEEVNGFTFISSKSALDKKLPDSLVVTLCERESKEGFQYFKYSRYSDLEESQTHDGE